VDDTDSVAAILVDEVVADTVTMIVDTVVSWSFATEVDDDNSATTTLPVGESVHVIPSTTVNEDGNSRTQSPVKTDHDDDEQPEVAVVVAPSEIEFVTSDVHLDNV
jgi:hypothetical protein